MGCCVPSNLSQFSSLCSSSRLSSAKRDLTTIVSSAVGQDKAKGLCPSQSTGYTCYIKPWWISPVYINLIKRNSKAENIEGANVLLTFSVNRLYYSKQTSSICQTINSPPVFMYKTNHIPLIVPIYNLVMSPGSDSFMGKFFQTFYTFHTCLTYGILFPQSMSPD